MKLGVLFSGGKDSTYAMFIADKLGYEISCLISVVSENKDSYMFHTPLIELVERQALSMNLPLIKINSKGEKELELNDLEKAVKKAVKDYKIKGVVTGAVGSVYQSSRIQKICDKLGIECFNPLWQKDQTELLKDLLKNKFEVIISKVSAYPLNQKWIGRKINQEFIEDVKKLNDAFGINPAGEGGEFESFVINSPMFQKRIQIYSFESKGGGFSYTMEVE